MDSDALVKWKFQIATYQQRTRKPALQSTLFDLAPVHSDPDAIDPFSQRLHPMSFYRMPADGFGACIYFVIDSAAQPSYNEILLQRAMANTTVSTI